MKGTQYIVKGKHGRDITLDMILPENRSEKAPLIIFLHGFKGFKDWGGWHLVAAYFAIKGFAFLKFNFSHNGVDPDNLKDLTDLEAFAQNNLMIELSDISVILDWVSERNEIDSNEVNLLGHSRAGGISLISARQQSRIKRVITWGAVSDYHRYIDAWDMTKWKQQGKLEFLNSRTMQIFHINYKFLEVLNANRKLLDVKEACSELKQPVMIIHAKDDQAVSYRQAEELSSWSSNATLLLVDDGGHTFGLSHPYTKNELPNVLRGICDQMIIFLNSGI